MTRRDERGFTLVEVLVAFAILSLAAVACYRAAGSGLRAIETAGATERAVLVAQSQMDRLVALRSVPEERNGLIAGTPYGWQVEVLPAAGLPTAPAQARQPLRLVLTVSWRNGNGGTRTLRLERLIFVDRAGG